MYKASCVAVVLSFLLTACQPMTTVSQTPAYSEEPNVNSSPSVSTPTPPAAMPSPTSAAAEPAKAYRITKNYDFDPIDQDGNKKVVLLTFDDGPKDRKTIESLLDTLDKHKARAIFFVNGYRAKQKPDLLKLLIERGQMIGNHSWDHIDLKKEPKEKVDQQIDDVQNLVKEETGHAPRFFRPPFGSANDAVKEHVKQEGMLFMTWSNGSLDWDTKTSDKTTEIIHNVLGQLHPGSNILMHELTWTADALDPLLSALEEKGYSFVDPHAIELP